MRRLAPNDRRPFDVNALNRVKRIGTGVMLIQTEALKKISESTEKYLLESSYYFGPPNPLRKYQHEFFKCQIEAETGNFVTEDLTSHFALHGFVLNMPAIASLGVAQPAKGY